jgi:hypothetical protein
MLPLLIQGVMRSTKPLDHTAPSLKGDDLAFYFEKKIEVIPPTLFQFSLHIPFHFLLISNLIHAVFFLTQKFHPT